MFVIVASCANIRNEIFENHFGLNYHGYLALLHILLSKSSTVDPIEFLFTYDLCDVCKSVCVASNSRAISE